MTLVFRNKDISMRAVVGVVLILTGAYLYAQTISRYYIDTLVKQDVRMDSVKESFRSLDDNLDSTVTVLTQKSSGTGFYLFPNYIITSLHVVSQTNAATGDIKVESLVRLASETVPFDGVVIAVDPKMDVALIKTAKVGSPVLVYNKNQVKVGDFIYSVGTNNTNFKSVKTGRVADLKSTFYYQNILLRAVLTTQDIQPGFSGGGAFDKYNVLVGINTGTGGTYKNQYSYITDFADVKVWAIANVIKDQIK